MLKTSLTHPQILQVLARSGHFDRVLIADGNFPALGTCGPRGEIVSLNLAPGLLGVIPVLDAVLSVLPVEMVYLMRPAPGFLPSGTEEPEIWRDIRRSIQNTNGAMEPALLDQFEFYQYVDSPRHVLTIQTAEMAPYANVLIEVGCRR